MVQYNLYDLGRGSPKDHLCQIIFKNGQEVSDKSFFFSFPIYAKEKLTPHPGGHVFLMDQNNFLVEGHTVFDKKTFYVSPMNVLYRKN